MKKILYIRNGPYKIDIKSYNIQEIGFSKELCKKGYDCDIVFYSDQNKDEIIYENNGNRVKLLWRKGIKILRTGIYPTILKKEFINKYDYIITTEYSQIMSLLLAQRHSKVIMYNGPYYNLFKIPICEKIYDFLFAKKLNRLLYKKLVKSQLAKGYLESKGFDEVIVLGVGLDVSSFVSNNLIPKDIEKTVKFMKKEKCMLYLGQLIDRKNFKFTIEVFKKVYKSDPTVKFVIIGNGESNYVNECFNLLDNDAKKNILHIEKIDNKYLRYIYEQADVFLLPSKLEIFGMVLLEAMYFGVPTITSINGGSKTLITNKINGIIIDEFNSSLWSKEVLEILYNEEYKNKLSSSAKRTIGEKYIWEKISETFVEILKK